MSATGSSPDDQVRPDNIGDVGDFGEVGDVGDVGDVGEVGLTSSADLSGEVLSSAHAMAREMAEAGDLTGARTVLEEALAAAELRYGRHDPQLAPLMVDLATIARNVGNLTEAQNQLRRAYGIVVAATGPEHATSLSIEGRLAAVNYRLGEPTEAYDWHIADVGARVLGPEHPAVRGAQQRLAATPIQEEQTPPAEAPPVWPQSYEATGGYDTGGWAAEYPGYAASPIAPGVYHRQSFGGADAEEVWSDDPQDGVDAPRTRGHGGGVALIGSLGLAIIAAAAVIAYQLFGGAASAGRASGPAGSPPTATTTVETTGQAGSPSPTSPAPYRGTGLPPGQVTLKDTGSSVTLSWLDPSDGQVPFIVAGGRSDVAAAPIVTVPAGRTTQTIYGLNPRFDYCFTVAAVWSTDLVQPSPQTCTKRASTPTRT